MDETEEKIVVFDPERDTRERMTAEELARLDALTDEDIERAAATDPDNPVLSKEEMDRADFAGFVRKLAIRLGLSKDAFADRFAIPRAIMETWWYGDRLPTGPEEALLRAINREPETMARLVAPAAE